MGIEKSYSEKIEKTRNELERFKVISEYYTKYSFMIKANQSYIEEIIEELIEISEKKLPKELEDSCSELFESFNKKCPYL